MSTGLISAILLLFFIISQVIIIINIRIIQEDIEQIKNNINIIKIIQRNNNVFERRFK